MNPASWPRLREDLVFSEAASLSDGSPCWTIHDPVTNRFVQVGALEFEILTRWAIGDPTLIAMSIRQDTAFAVTVEQVSSFVQFLLSQELCMCIAQQDTEGLILRAAKARKQWSQWLLHNYLFFRISLVRPGNFFHRALPVVQLFFNPVFWGLTALAAALGLFLVARQWDTFVHSVVNNFSWSGLFFYAVALIFAKTLHELGHAFTATRLGCRVAHMGVAFLVLWPMLYTDTSESWKLKERKERFQIAGAGMAVEIALAAWCTLGWALAPSGAIRDALFFLGTTSWILTLFLNVSPFMRFDGYFLMSDWLDLPNLHSRSGELAKTWLRRLILGSQELYATGYSKRLRKFLIAFALTTWAYRLVIFLGIAVAVYVFFFKLLGIFLFVVEIVWFILRPLWAEIKQWPAISRQAQSGRSRWSLLLVIAIVALLFFPLDGQIHSVGWLRPERQQVIYSPFSARLVELRVRGPIAATQSIARLDSPDVRSRGALSVVAIDSLIKNLDQTVGTSDGKDKRATILQQIEQERAQAKAQIDELERLELSAPFAGTLVDVSDELKAGTWVNPGQAIAVLIDPDTWVVEALVEQEDIGRVAVGATAKVYRPGELTRGLNAEVIAIDRSRVQALPHPMLAADHGGSLLASRNSAGQLIPKDGLYRIRLKLIGASKTQSAHIQSADTQTGSRPVVQSFSQSVSPIRVRVVATKQSFAGRWLRSAWAVLIRESGF